MKKLRVQIDPSQKIIQSTGRELSPVAELTMYPKQFAIFMRDRLHGLSVAEAAELLGIKAADVMRLLDGEWRPSKEICRKMGLTMVYAVSERARF